VPSPASALPPLLVIGGPTATGKTALAIAVAQAIPGTEVISADSRQVYRGMDIGTAKVSAAERKEVPHHGLDLVDPDHTFTAADFRRHALLVLGGMAGRAPLAVLVGGTGLYLRAVGRGMPLDETGTDPAERARLEDRLEQEGVEALAAELVRIAPKVAAETDLANPRRVVRALERVHVRGDKTRPAPVGYPAKVGWLGLDLDASTHDGWIEHRARQQFASGLVEEARSLRERYDPGLPAFSAFGYREAFDILDGRATAADAVAADALRTRRFARRQRTWFRAEPEVNWLRAGEPQNARIAIEAGRRLSG
jgi:tRNA dimethylallyltransferase